jgi:predicted RecA/RadA family phage recombinase
MKNWKGLGDTIHVIAPNGGTVGGAPVFSAALHGVWGDTARAGDEVAVKLNGEAEFTVARPANAALPWGTKVYFKTASTLTVVAGDRLADSPVFGALSRDLDAGTGATAVARIVFNGLPDKA